MRYKLSLAIVSVLAATACGGSERPVVPDAPTPPTSVVPDVLYEDLDDAKEELVDAGIEPIVIDEGTGAIVVESNWTVCEQYPLPGEYAEEVELYVEHFCED